MLSKSESDGHKMSERIDVYMTQIGLSASRKRAQDDIRAGFVFLNGKPVEKPSTLCAPTDRIELRGHAVPFVGRGGLKLDHALNVFSVDVAGKRCVDVGASTGGFTDCLLRRGAAFVTAVDCGVGQLDLTLKENPHVKNLEGFNAKMLTPNETEGKVRFACSDVSFISIRKLIGPIYSVLEDGGDWITLVKPQFEVGRKNLGKGGIVKDPEARLEALKDVICDAGTSGFHFSGVCVSPILGGDGNQEFLAYFRKEQEPNREFFIDIPKIKTILEM